MQQDMRINKQNQLKVLKNLISSESMFFYTNIVNKYVSKIKLSEYSLLDYLLQKSSSFKVNKSTKNIFSSVNFHSKLLEKQFSNYTFIQRILHQKYSNARDKTNHNTYIDKQKSTFPLMENIITKEKNILMPFSINGKIFHNQQSILKESKKKQSRKLQIDKKETTFPLMENIITKEKNILMPFSINDRIFHNQQSILKESKKNQSRKLQIDKEETTFYQRERSQNIIINNQIKTTPFQYKDTDQNSASTEANIIYASYQNRTSPQEVYKHTKEKNVTEIKNTNQPITVEKTVKNINYYEIKKIAEKVYPLVMKQWQKEFEKRGVFNG